MKMLVFGNGWLGRIIASHFDVPVSTMDILDLEMLRGYIHGNQPDVVVNAAGKSGVRNVDWCEREENRKPTMWVNGFGPRIPEHACEMSGGDNIRFIHLSSGCLWESGEDVGVTDRPAPPSWYSHTKWAGEQRLCRTGDMTAILRIRMPFDHVPHPRNLITKLAGYHDIIDIPNSVTAVPLLLRAIHVLMEHWTPGVHHVVNRGTLSPWHVVERYNAVVDPLAVFRKVGLDELRDAGKIVAKRSNVTLNADGFYEMMEKAGIAVPAAEAALETALKEYKFAKRRMDGEETVEGV